MRVLIAVDGTDHSVTVAQTAHRLFGEAAEYLVLNVSQVPVTGWGAPFGSVSPMAAPMMPTDVTGLWPADLDETNEAARAQAEGVAESSSLGDADAIGDTGDPPSTIIDAATKHDVDVIVIGHEDRSWFSRVVEGSVSKEVIRESHVPVLVVPYGGKEHHHHHHHADDPAEASS